MSRCAVTIRDAEPDDVAALADVLSGVAARGLEESGPQEAAHTVARIAADPDQRLMVAVTDGRLVGVLLLVRAPLTPLHAETAVHVLQLEVVDSARRHGIGRALMEAAVSWAEEKGTDHVLAAAAAGARDGNRFLARLGLREVIAVRGATTAALRAKLPVEPPSAALVDRRSHRSVGQVLAQRRSLRRAQDRSV